MIHNSPNDFLSLHKNIQYFNSHKDDCFLDNNLNVIHKNSTDAVITNSINEIAGLILNRVKDLYSGTDRDNKWLTLIKNDIKQLDIQARPLTSKILVEMDKLQQQSPKGPQPVDWLKEGILNVTAIFDQDADDLNGLMKTLLYSAMRSPDNLITVPMSVFRSSPIERWKQYLVSQNLVLLQQKEAGFLVLVPKNLCKDLDTTSSLAHLGLDPGQLTQVTLDDIYANPKKVSSTIEQWERLWSSSSQIKKRWHFAGHGTSESIQGEARIAALSPSRFTKLINIVKKQNTELVSVFTCHVGRTIPEQQQEWFPEGDFPVLLWGRTDVPIFGRRTDFSLFWVGIHHSLNNDFYGQKVGASLNSFFNKYNEELPELARLDNFQFYEGQPLLLPAHSKESPVGFKSLEGSKTQKVFSIYYNDIRATQLASQKSSRWKDIKPNEIIIPSEKENIEFYPPVLDTTLRLKHEKIKFQSMIPGNAQHYIHKIILETGKFENLLKSIIQEYNEELGERAMKNSKGFYIASLETSDGTFNNVSILMTPKENLISYFDSSLGEYRSAILSVKALDAGFTWGNTSKEEIVLSTAKFLIDTYPASKTVQLATGGQSDNQDVFECIFQNLSEIFGDSDQQKKLHSCLLAIASNKIDSNILGAIEGLSKNLQFMVIQRLFKSPQYITILKELCRKAWIDEKIYKLIKELPSKDMSDKDKSELYDLLIEQGIIKEPLIEEILDKLDLSGELLINSWVKHHVDNLSSVMLEKIYKLVKKNYRGQVHSSGPLLQFLLSNEDLARSLDMADLYKCGLTANQHSLNDTLFLDSKDILIKALNQQKDPRKFLVDIIPLLVETCLSDGLKWILSYNREHRLITQKKCLELIRDGVKSHFNNLSCYTQKRADPVLQLVSSLPENTLSVLDRISLLELSLSKDKTLSISKKLLTKSLVRHHPEIRSLVLKQISNENSSSESQNLLDFLDRMDLVFRLTAEEKCQLLNSLWPQAIMKGGMLMTKLSAWMSLIEDEESKQELLRKSLGASIDFETLITLGLDTSHKKFVASLEKELLSYATKPFSFYLKHMKPVLDNLPNDFHANLLKEWNFRIKPSVELLECIFTERGIKIDANEFKEILRLMSKSLIATDRFDYMPEKSFRELELIADWFSAHNFELEDLSDELKSSFIQLVPRMLSDGCSIGLIKKLLALYPQAEQKNIYERVFKISVMRGRIDVLQFLLDQGGRFSMDTLQLALFYAAERGDVQTQEIIKKFPEEIQ